MINKGYSSKKHRNTVKIDDETLKGWIADSYNLVVKSLPKKLSLELK